MVTQEQDNNNNDSQASTKEEIDNESVRKLMYDLPEVMIYRILVYLIENTKKIESFWNYVLVNSIFSEQCFALIKVQKEAIKLDFNDKLQENIDPILKSKLLAENVCRLGLEIN